MFSPIPSSWCFGRRNLNPLSRLSLGRANFHIWRQALAGITCAFLSASAAGQVVEHRSAVFVLVDLSKTWHRMDTQSRNQALLKKVSQGVVELVGRIERPTYVAFVAIDDRSILQTPICEATYNPKLLPSKTVVIQRARELGSFLNTCSAAALSRPIALATDISGALDFASRLLGEGPKSIDRYVIILSDMKEERGARMPVELRLNGFRMLLTYRALPEDDRNPDGFERRITDWRKRLNDAGARVSRVLDTGLVGQSIADLAYGQQ